MNSRKYGLIPIFSVFRFPVHNDFERRTRFATWQTDRRTDIVNAVLWFAKYKRTKKSTQTNKQRTEFGCCRCCCSHDQEPLIVVNGLQRAAKVLQPRGGVKFWRRNNTWPAPGFTPDLTDPPGILITYHPTLFWGAPQNYRKCCFIIIIIIIIISLPP